jgi:hypothetical protein
MCDQGKVRIPEAISRKAAREGLERIMSTEDGLEFESITDALAFTPISADDKPEPVMRTCRVCGGYYPAAPGSPSDRAALCRTHLLVTHALMRRDQDGWTEYDHDPYTRHELDTAAGLTQACRGWLDDNGITSGEWKLEARNAETGVSLAESEVVKLTEKKSEETHGRSAQPGSVGWGYGG